MWWRINSQYLPDTDYSDYLIDQYQDILDVCNVTNIPESIIRPLPEYPQAPNVTYLLPGSDPASNDTSNANVTCNGQTISPGAGGCNALSSEYGVTTGDLQAVTDTDDCSASDDVCVPLSCTLSQVTGNTSWYDIMFPGTCRVHADGTQVTALLLHFPQVLWMSQHLFSCSGILTSWACVIISQRVNTYALGTSTRNLEQAHPFLTGIL